jgi:translocation and assembly module TamB
MAKRIKQTFVGLGILLGVAVALVGGVLFYFQTQHGQRLIQAKVNEMIPGAISFENLRYSLLKGRFELTNVVVKGPSEDNLAGFERLSVDLSWIPLLRGNLMVAAFVLEKPWVNVQVDREGRTNLMRAFSPLKPEDTKPENGKGPGIPFNIVVKSLKLVQGLVRYETAHEGFKVVVREINVTADGNLSNRSGSLTLQTGKAGLEHPGLKTEFGALKLETTLKEGRIDPLVLQASTGGSKLRLSGHVRDVFREPDADLVLDLAVSLPEVQRSLRLESPLTGEVKARLAARGAPDNPEVILDLAYGGGNLGGIQTNDMALDCSMKDRLLTLQGLRAHIASGELTAHGKVDLSQAFSYGFLAPQRDVEAVSYELFLKQKNIKLEQALADAGKLSGTVHSRLSVTGRGVSPKHLSAKLALDILAQHVGAGQVGGPIDAYVKTVGQIDAGIATLQHLEAEAGNLRLQAEGLYDFSSRAVKGQISLKAPNLADTLPSFSLNQTSGALDLEADLSGSIEQPLFDCRLRGDQLRFQDIVIGDIRLNANLDQAGTLRVSQLVLENQGSSIRGAGSVRIFAHGSTLKPTLPLGFSLALQDVEAGDFVKNRLVRGTMDGQLEIGGSLKALQGTLSLRAKDLATEAVRFGDLDMDLRLSEGTLHLDRVRLQNQESEINISGTAQILDQKTMQPLGDPIFHVDIEGATVFVEDFVDQLKGEVSLAAHFEGSPTKPRGSVHLEGENLDLGVQELQAFKVVSRMDGERILIDPIEITIAPGELIEGKGWFSLRKAYDVSLVTKGISLQHIDWVREQEIADGKILFDISGKGTLENPQIRGDITLSQLLINGKPLDDCRIRVDLHDQLATVSAKLDFDLNGTFHVQKRDFSASILFDHTRLAPYLKIAGQTDLSGTLTGKIEAAGNMEAFDRIQAHIDLSEFDLFSGEKELVHARDLKASLKEGEASTPGLHLALLREGWLDITGTVKHNGPIDVQVKGNIPLCVASLFTEDLPDATGDIMLSGSVGGTQVHPDMQAEIGLKEIGFTIPALFQKMHHVNGRIQISPTAITIDRIEGHLDTGRFDLAGRIDLEAFQPAQAAINFNANALPLQVPDTMDLLLNTQLHLFGTREESVIEGEAVVLEGTYYRDVNLSLLQTVEQKKREEPPPPAEVAHPFLRNTNLDVTIKSRNPFVVQNNLAALDIVADLRITGKLNNPIIMGRAEVASGTINYRKKDFLVNKGVIDFLSPYKTEATVDIRSEVKVRHWIIWLAISGTPDALTFKLTSNPPESDGDILSLLVIGRTTSELIEGEGGSSKSTSQRLTEMIASRFGEDIQQATGLDILEAETGEEGEESSDQIKVTIGKELSKRMVVKYAMERKDGEMIQRAISEYKLLEHILLSGFQDTKGIFGGEIQFRLEFR